MLITRSRPTAAVLSLLMVLALAGPASATDPTPAPQPAAPEEAAGTPTVHAEMLAEHASDALEFTPGDAPAPLDVGGDTATIQADGTGTIAALPNGLKREVYGYLPYWATTSTQLANLDYGLLSTIAYFSVGANANGTLAKTVSGETTVGWAGWNSSAMSGVINRAHERGVKVVLTVTMMAWGGDYTAMSTLLNNGTYSSRLATEIATAVRSRNADGVNLDFEPMPNSLESAYTSFVRKVKAELVRLGAGSYLTVATTGGAASWDEGYELRDNADADAHSLVSAGSADALMVMAYDFNWGGSSRAGGVAPIDSPYVLDSRDAMRAYLSKVPASKLIWGVPYYGRAWTTQTSGLNSLTCRTATICPTGKVAAEPFGRSWAPRYVDARQAAATYGRRWDATGQVPWYTYYSSTYGTQVQGYYDDAQSLGVKYDHVNANGLRGVGIWHLTMDGSRRELWETLYTRFGPLPFTDISTSKFVRDIVWLEEQGITNGCTETRFCPEGIVLRDQMASFLARALDLPAASRDYFTDDNGNKHESNINRLAQAGITVGCTATTYCPGGAVLRDQMATFLSRALSLPSTTRDFYTDDEGNIHEDRINRLAAADVTRGCATGRYCPSGAVTRQQMAAFLHRALGS